MVGGHEAGHVGQGIVSLCEQGCACALQGLQLRSLSLGHVPIYGAQAG